jgi:hypothetical protein
METDSIGRAVGDVLDAALDVRQVMLPAHDPSASMGTRFAARPGLRLL